MLDNKTIMWLSDEQNMLDKQIEQKHRLTLNQEILNKKMIAFWVELAEYANEEKSFKYWKQGAPGAHQLQLEEYIDGLHFVISIGNQLKFNFAQYHFQALKVTDIITCYIAIIDALNQLIKHNSHAHYIELLNAFLHISVLKQMDEHELITTYKTKHQKNQQRQVDNY